MGFSNKLQSVVVDTTTLPLSFLAASGFLEPSFFAVGFFVVSLDIVSSW